MTAIIDIGSNTIRLSAYEIGVGGSVCQTHKSKRFVGLAGYISPQNALSAAGIAAACAVLNEFRAELAGMNIAETHAFATASLRGIVNAAEVIQTIKRETGFDVTIISGEEEALCAYAGASINTPIDDGILVDIGGGSTEFVFCENGTPVKTASITAGALSMYSRHVDGLLPTQAQSEKIYRETSEMLEAVGVDRVIPMMYGVGGTMRAFCKLNESVLGGSSSDPCAPTENAQKILNHVHTAPNRMLVEFTRTVPERARVITPGLVILSAIIDRYGCERITVSESGVREGYLIRKVLIERRL